MATRKVLITLILLSSAALTAAPAKVIKLDPYRNTYAVHANVGGRDGYFLFDTGGGLSLINPSFAEQIGCKPWGRTSGYSMMGNRMDSERCDDVPVTIGGEKLTSPITGVMDVRQFFPKDAAPVDGLISLNIFEGRAITLDFRAGTLTLETPSTLRKRVAGATEVPVRFEREVSGTGLAVVVGVPTSKGRVWMELDTGNNRMNLISKPFAALFGMDPEKKEPQDVDFVLAGDIHVKGKASAPDMIIDGNLGMPFLKDTIVTIDFAAKRLWIRHGNS